MMETIAMGGISAAVTGIVQVLIWLAIRRSIESQDKEITRLRESVENFMEKRICRIEQDIFSASNARKKIHEDIESLRMEFTAQVVDMRVVVSNCTTEIRRCVEWLKDLQEEQISIGKDVARAQGHAQGAGHHAG
jgi:chromosome segregation ATPase